MTANSVINNHTQNKNNSKLSKLLVQEKNDRNGDHMEGYQWGVGWGEMGGKVKGIRSINDRYKIDRRWLRIE